MPSRSDTVVLPDAGPLITLAYADALDLLLQPGWPVEVVDMVLHEVTRSLTPTSEKLAQWVHDRRLSARRSQNRPCELFRAGQLPQDQHAILLALP